MSRGVKWGVAASGVAVAMVAGLFVIGAVRAWRHGDVCEAQVSLWGDSLDFVEPPAMT